MKPLYEHRSFKKVKRFAIPTAITAVVVVAITCVTVTRSVQNHSVKDDQAIAATAGAIDVDGKQAENAIAVPVQVDKNAISTYTVVSGDTLSSIAAKFNISVNTIRWANDLTSKSKIRVGDVLTILPVTGVEYTVKKGDTISGIAKRFGSNQKEIIDSNDLASATAIKIGMVLVIPDAEPTVSEKKEVAKDTPKKEVVKKETPTVSQKEEKPVATKQLKKEEVPVSQPVITTKTTDSDEKTATSDGETKNTTTNVSQFIMPIPGGQISQGLHGANGIDFRAPIGTPVLAAASGTVIVAKGSGAYNGGYGNYIVISHDNGTQTLYAHLASVSVTVGDTVTQSQVIAKSGNTGKSTGPHLHFEVRGAKNPFANVPKFTQY